MTQTTANNAAAATSLAGQAAAASKTVPAAKAATPVAKKTTVKPAAKKSATTTGTSKAAKPAAKKTAAKPAAKKTKPAAKKSVKPAAKKATSKVVKVAGEPRKSRKAEKFNMLEQMLQDAKDNDKYVTKEQIAKKIGATPGSVGVMISELRKDTTKYIERTDEGYRFGKKPKAA